MNTAELIVLIVGLIVLFLLLILVCFPFILIHIANNKMFGYHDKEIKHPAYLLFEDYEDKLDREKFKIDLNEKEYVCGYYYTPKGIDKSQFKGFIVLSPGYGGTHTQYLLDIAFLCKLGFKVMAYDQIGTGDSSSKTMHYIGYSQKTLSKLLEKINEQNLDQDLDIILYGHSWGAYGVVAGLTSNEKPKNNENSLPQYAKVTKIISRSGFNDPIQSTRSAVDKIGPSAFFLKPFIKPYYKMRGCNAWKSCTSSYESISQDQQPKLLIIYAMNDDAICYKDSLAAVYKENEVKNPNVEVFITEKGGHNSILSEEGLNRFKEVKKTYDELPSEEEKVAYISTVSKVKEYTYFEEVTSKIESFLLDK